MRAHPVIRRAPVATDTNIPTTTETVLATLSGVATQAADGKVELDGFAQVTLGTATTALTLRVRRGIDATGTLVGEGNPVQGAAGNTVLAAVNVEDTPGDGSFSYVLTAVQTAATGNGTAVQAALTATY